jgi:hypothetical protein
VVETARNLANIASQASGKVKNGPVPLPSTHLSVSPTWATKMGISKKSGIFRSPERKNTKERASE